LVLHTAVIPPEFIRDKMASENGELNMKTVLRRLAVGVVFLGWAQIASAQTADEIVEKHLAAIGGRAALAKLKSRSMVGTMTVSTQAGQVSGSIEILNQAPNKTRTLIKLDLSALGAGQMVLDQRFDGKSGYVIDTLRGNREITGQQLEEMSSASFPNPFLNYKEMGATVELGGKEKVGERDAYVLLFKSKAGFVARQYVDAESFLPLKATVKITDPQVGEIEQTTELFEQRDVDGVKVPFQVKSTNAFQSSIINITKVEHNTTIDETLFSKPAGDGK
jgi:outer membrane lipoprotein-sorting protein